MDTETVVRDSQRRFESASASLEPELEHLDQRGEFSSDRIGNGDAARLCLILDGRTVG